MSPTLRQRARRSRRGFTLVELMVSLVTGVVIAIAVVGLARTATNNFHEEVRMSAVEMALRGASERLRGDLSRAGYMSTGNIRWDPKCAARRNENCSRYGALTNEIATVWLRRGLSRANSGVFGSEGTYNLATKNGLNPDVIDIWGNLTSSDSFQAQIIAGNGSVCGGQQIRINTSEDAALTRLLQGTTDSAVAASLVSQAFTPFAGTFLVRVSTVIEGKSQFIPVCGVSATPTSATIELQRDTTGAAILSSVEGGANEQEYVAVNPVSRVRWYIGPNTNAALAPDPQIEPATNKFNLYRSTLNAAGNVVNTELVAENTVDLKFGVVAHDVYNTDPTKRYVVADFDDSTNLMEPWVAQPTSTVNQKEGPQRIRSMRYRLSVRSHLPDRTANLVVAPGPYIARYCIDDVALASCKNFARVRTFVSEVSIFNQARSLY